MKVDPATEIVGALIGTKIYCDIATIRTLLEETDAPWELITRERMQFMAACDMGKRWSDAAQWPTLFLRDRAGNLSWPKTDGCQDG